MFVPKNVVFVVVSLLVASVMTFGLERVMTWCAIAKDTVEQVADEAMPTNLRLAENDKWLEQERQRLDDREALTEIQGRHDSMVAEVEQLQALITEKEAEYSEKVFSSEQERERFNGSLAAARSAVAYRQTQVARYAQMIEDADMQYAKREALYWQRMMEQDEMRLAYQSGSLDEVAVFEEQFAMFDANIAKIRQDMEASNFDSEDIMKLVNRFN